MSGHLEREKFHFETYLAQCTVIHLLVGWKHAIVLQHELPSFLFHLGLAVVSLVIQAVIDKRTVGDCPSIFLLFQCLTFPSLSKSQGIEDFLGDFVQLGSIIDELVLAEDSLFAAFPNHTGHFLAELQLNG